MPRATMRPSKGRGLITSFKEWKKLFEKNDGWNKVLDDLATAPSGTRAWPNRTKDHNVSFRIVYGLSFTGSDGRPYRNLELQVNGKSKDPRVAAVANADSNQILAIITIPADSPPGAGEFMEKLGELSSFTGSDGHPYQNLELQADKKGKDTRVAAVADADSHRVLATTTVPAEDSCTIATMERGKVQGLKTSFKKWKKLFGKNDGWDKVLDNLATAPPGTRAWPNRTKDHNVSFRIDYGPSFTGPDGRPYRNLDLQANKKT
ncbi:hypothetical protein HD554DRAFT_2148110 [Boletus coccyginus]|nr:hypothetical protein HD554DRAFT_2148110 [Boletus coccyginus]